MNKKHTIKELRERHWLTQRDLAARLGVHYQTVQSWETFKARPRMRNVVMIAEFFGIEPEDVALTQKDAVEGAIEGLRRVNA